MKLKRIAIVSVLSLFITLSTVSAASLGALEGPFKIIFDALQNQWVVYGLTFLFYFMLFYGIYASALKFVNVFKSEHGISHQGKVVAMALSGLSLLSIFYYTDKQPETLITTLLDPFGVFGGLVLAALFAGITYFGIKGADNNSGAFTWAAFAAGIGMVFVGMIQVWDSIMMWGFFIMFVAMLIGLANYGWHNWRGDGHGNGGGHDQGHGGGHQEPQHPLPPHEHPPQPLPHAPRIDHINENRLIEFTGHDINDIHVDGERLDTVTGGRITDYTGANTLAEFAQLNYHPHGNNRATITIPAAIHANQLYYRLYLSNGHGETYNFFGVKQTSPPHNAPHITHLNGQENDRRTPIQVAHDISNLIIEGTNLRDARIGGIFEAHNRTALLGDFSTLNYAASDDNNATMNLPAGLRIGVLYALVLKRDDSHGDMALFILARTTPQARNVPVINRIIPEIIDNTNDTIVKLEGDNLNASTPINGYVINAKTKTPYIIPSEFGKLKYSAASNTEAQITITKKLFRDGTYRISLSNKTGQGNEREFTIKKGSSPEPRLTLATGKALTFLDVRQGDIEIIENCENLSGAMRLAHSITSPNLGFRLKDGTIFQGNTVNKTFKRSQLLNVDELSDAGSIIFSDELESGGKQVHAEIIFALLEERAETITENIKFSSISKINPDDIKADVIGHFNKDHEIAGIVDSLVRELKSGNDPSILSVLDVLDKKTLTRYPPLNELLRDLRKNVQLTTKQLVYVAKTLERTLKNDIEKMNAKNPEKISDAEKLSVNNMIVVHEVLMFLANYAIKNLKPQEKTPDNILLLEDQKWREQNTRIRKKVSRVSLGIMDDLKEVVKEFRKLHPDGSLYWDRDLKEKELKKLEAILTGAKNVGFAQESIKLIDEAIHDIATKKGLIEISRQNTDDARIYHETMNNLVDIVENKIIPQLKNAQNEIAEEDWEKAKDNPRDVLLAKFHAEATRMRIINQVFSDILVQDNVLKQRIMKIYNKLQYLQISYEKMLSRYSKLGEQSPADIKRDAAVWISKEWMPNASIIRQEYKHIIEELKRYGETNSSYHDYFENARQRYREELKKNGISETLKDPYFLQENNTYPKMPDFNEVL